MNHIFDDIEFMNDIKIIIVDHLSNGQSGTFDEIINVNNSQFQLCTIIGSIALGEYYK